MFVVNNPWKGALPGPDMAIVAPIFADGELIFWSGGLMHMADIGGMREGGIGLDATECYQEGLLMPPVKLVENGSIRADIWSLIVSQSRAEFAMTLDLKGLMAANHAAAEGIGKLIDRYGVPVLRSVMARLIQNAGMPRWTAWSWRFRDASISASLSSVPTRLTLRPLDLAEPAFAFGFGDAVVQVGPDLLEPVPLGGVRPQE